MKSLSLKISVTALILILAMLLSVAGAENDPTEVGKNPQAAIHITANQIKGYDDGNRIFEGDVTFKQANLTVTCDKLIVASVEESTSKKLPNDFDSNGIASITALANVKIGYKDWEATAAKALYHNINRTITLTESPRIYQGRDAATADKIIMYLDENRVELDLQGRCGPALPYEAKKTKK